MDLESLKYFLLFIGRGRSGSSLFGALLNSHPNMVIRNELDIFELFELKFTSEDQIYRCILENKEVWGQVNKRRGEYEWVYGYENLKIIGTKKGGRTAEYFTNNYDDLEVLKKLLSVPIKFIHIKRNIYDNIATILNKGGPKHGFSDLDTAINRYFKDIETIQRVRKNEDVFEVKHEEFVSKPKEILTLACNFLELPVTEDYLDFCSSVVWKDPRITRTSVEWTDEHLSKVEKLKNEVDFLKEYTFED